ncbi:hypothetical protein HY733_03000 [Candidatus Uhrbacteria bacterium]|nr:hypothetical protein [Candidatus Uhrbacteria bacterium]
MRKRFQECSRNKKHPSWKRIFFGRDSKTALELTVGIILSLENYEKANVELRELVVWKSTIPAFAIAL